MKAVVYDEFAGPLRLATVPDPTPEKDGVVIRVEATGICRSDWHGWRGHDPDIVRFPHVPGHELSGVIEAIGGDVRRWKPGDRVTVPFVSGCGTCPECLSGNHQVCDRQFQPGFTHWGSFAQLVSIAYADTNLVRLPAEVDFVTAASLGCRFATSFRAVVEQGGIEPGEWVAIHGCGGVGLAAVMIASALGGQVIAVDLNPEALDLARSLGAIHTLEAREGADPVRSIREITGRGAHLSLDAVGSTDTCTNSILCLRKRGRHVQVGLLVGRDLGPRLPMERVVAWELEIRGSHGMQAHRYDEMMTMIVAGTLEPRRMVRSRVTLEDVPGEFDSMGRFDRVGVTVVDRF